MAKNIRRMLALVMVMCMFVSALPMQSLAAEEDAPFTETDTISGGEVVITITPSTSNSGESTVEVSGTNESGSTVDLTGTSTTTSGSTTDSEGNVTDSSSTHVVLEGKETTADGTEKTVNYEETTVESSTTNANGEEINSRTEIDGSETKVWDAPGEDDGTTEPDVTVDLIPGKETSNIGIVEGSLTTETTTKADGTVITETNYEVDRTVTAETSDITITESEYLDFDLKPIESQENPKDTVDVNWDAFSPMSNRYDKITFGDETRWVPRFERREDQMLPELMDFYNEKVTPVTDENGDPVTDENGNPVTVKTYVPKNSGTYSTNHGEFFLFGTAGNAVSSYKMLHESGDDENGSYLIRVCDEFGVILPTYCMDEVTSTSGGYAYILENLDDATYFEGTAEEQQAAKAQVRAIALKGYWGTEDGMGSLDQIKADMKAFIENNPDFAFTYTVDPATVAEGEEMPADQTFSVANNKEYLLQLIDLLNEGGALTVTQSAIWEHGRGIDTPEIVYKKGAEESFNQALTLFREYLLSEALQETAQLKETVIYDQDSFLVEDSLKLTVGDKISDSEANTNEDADDDVYNVDMSFKLVVAPGEKDDLVVCLVDSNNTIVRKARIAGDAVEGETSDEIIVGEDGSYTFTDVPLQENSDIAFNLKLEGIQYLEKGVYIYKAVKNDGTTDYGHAQTLIGVGEGSHEVGVTTAFTVNFNVDEENHIVTETVWHYDSDPAVKNPEDPTPNQKRDGKIQVFRLNNQDNLVEIPEEPVPLATPAVTGDNSGLWIAVVLLSVFAMAAINLFDKKRQHESF